ncbi:MAG: hypothetical protein ABH919_04265 [bacterium]
MLEIAGAVIGLFIAWVLLGFRVVKKDEMGVKVFFGKIGEEKLVDHPNPIIRLILSFIYGFCDSGLHWAPRLPGCSISTIPKKRFELDYKERLVISKADTDKSLLGKQLLLIDTAVYMEFGRDFKSVKWALERGAPTEEQELLDKTNSIIDDAIRAAVGEMNWILATEKVGREKIGEEVLKRLTDEKSFLALIGINIGEIEVAIKSVNLKSEELKKSIAGLEIERIQEQSAGMEAGRMQKEVEVAGKIRKTLADSGMSPDVADQATVSLIELNTAKDLHQERGDVLKVIRFGPGMSAKDSSLSIPKIVAEVMASYAATKSFLPDGGKTEKEKDDEEDDEEELSSEDEIQRALDDLQNIKKRMGK